MAAPVRALFVTYSVLSDAPGITSMIGVLKRCLRLAERLPPGAVDAHLVNFGTLPAADPLVARAASRLTLHEGPGTRAGCRELCRALRPDVVVLGEGPGGGMMSAMARGASLEGIPMICVENLYGAWQPRRFADSSPTVAEWLLLGLPPEGRGYGRWGDRVVVAPPLLPPPARPAPEMEMTVLGYDAAVAERGLALLGRLPRGTRARLVGVAPGRARAAAARPGVELVPFPEDGELRGMMAASRMVVCKSGFQQMVESLAVGTPVLAVHAAGGVPQPWLDPALARFVRYLPNPGEGWAPALAAAAAWLGTRPQMPWTDVVARVPDPAACAAGLLLGALRRRATPA